MSSADAVRACLGALGVHSGRMPADLPAQVALYRSLLAGRRMLIVLDNVRDSAQVRPLLPASSGCLVVVTSRQRLTGLAVAEGARQLGVDTLGSDDALRLLVGRLGGARVAAEPEAVAALIESCAGLPLALSIAAARCAAHPGFTLASLVAQLRDDVLSGGEVGHDLRVQLQTSYRHLSSGAARMFRLLGHCPGGEISVPVAASVAGIARPLATATLDELATGHLLEERSPRRYGMHDLVRAYAAEVGQADPDRDEVVDRAIDHYVTSLDHADRLLHRGADAVLRPAATPAT
jgi:hypothetical protein